MQSYACNNTFFDDAQLPTCIINYRMQHMHQSMHGWAGHYQADGMGPMKGVKFYFLSNWSIHCLPMIRMWSSIKTPSRPKLSDLKLIFGELSMLKSSTLVIMLIIKPLLNPNMDLDTGPGLVFTFRLAYWTRRFLTCIFTFFMGNLDLDSSLVNCLWSSSIIYLDSGHPTQNLHILYIIHYHI